MQLEKTRPTTPITTTGDISVRGKAALQALPVRTTVSYRSLRSTGRRGLLIVGVSIAVLAGLIGQTTIAGAVVSSGLLVVDTGSKPVQHVSGGTVAEVLVKNGDRVDADQVLIRLDDAAIAPRLTASSAQLLQNRALLARLEAERDELAEPTFPPLVSDTEITAAAYANIIAAEREQFVRRRDQLGGQIAELYQQIKQAEARLAADQAQLSSVSEQLAAAQEQLDKLTILHAKELLPLSKVAEAQRNLWQLQGSEGSLQSTIAADKGKVAELKVTRIQVQRTWRSEIAQQISETQTSIAQLTEQVALLRDQTERLSIRAPYAGIVHELGAFARGSVIQPAQQLLLIVPEHDKLVGRIRVRPQDIDQLYPGQPVTIQFAAFERATTPSATGHLAEISADLVEDNRTGSVYYNARILPDDMSAFASTGLKLVPGMPIEAFIRTEDRTIFSYLAKPLVDQLNRAFR